MDKMEENILEELREKCLQVLEEGKFTQREIRILQLRFFSEDISTLEEIGKKFHVSRDRIRQILSRAERRLHHFSSKAQYDILRKYWFVHPEDEKKFFLSE